jgi:hypothetical protein
MIKINPEMNVVLLVDYDDQVKYDLVTDNKFWCHADRHVLAVKVSTGTASVTAPFLLPNYALSSCVRETQVTVTAIF